MQNNWPGSRYLLYHALLKRASCGHHFEGYWEHKLRLHSLVEHQRQRGHWLPPGECTGHFLGPSQQVGYQSNSDFFLRGSIGHRRMGCSE